MKGISLALSYILQVVLIFSARVIQELEYTRILAFLVVLAEFAVLVLALYSISGGLPSRVYKVLIFPVLLVAGMYFLSASLLFMVPDYAK